jgi:hypothetical protein
MKEHQVFLKKHNTYKVEFIVPLQRRNKLLLNAKALYFFCFIYKTFSLF